MAKVFIGIALALMLATAALSFLAKGNIDKLQSTLTETKGSRDAAEKKAKAEGERATTAESARDAATAKTEETAKQLADKAKETDDLSKQINEQKMMVETKAKEVEDLTKKLADASKPVVGGEKEDPRVAELTAKLQEAQRATADAQLAADGLNKRVADTEAKLSAAEQKEKLRLAGGMRAGMQARILAVNAGWNFVVLSAGDKQGVIVNAPLLVVRNNEPIARLRITSVEPSTSIADVIPGSVRKGVSVQPGDTVIFEGRSSATESKTPESGAGAEPKLP
jgi:hypothetical protein